MTAFFCINVWLIPSPDGDIGFNQTDDEGKTSYELRFMFPSPDGDIGFNRVETTTKEDRHLVIVFPSPDGDIGFNREETYSRNICIARVSVP